LSFGQALLFISNSQQANILIKSDMVVPTNTYLFFAEFRPQKKLRVPVFFNLSTESKQFIINGNLVNEKAPNTFGTGLMLTLFHIKIDSISRLEFEAGPLPSLIFNTKKPMMVAPIIAGRFRIIRGENFVMYLGLSYTIGINTLGMLYGTGTVF